MLVQYAQNSHFISPIISRIRSYIFTVSYLHAYRQLFKKIQQIARKAPIREVVSITLKNNVHQRRKSNCQRTPVEHNLATFCFHVCIIATVTGKDNEARLTCVWQSDSRMFLTACCIKQKVPSITRSRAPPSKNGRTSSIIIPLPSAPLQLVHDTLCTDPWMGELFPLFHSLTFNTNLYYEKKLFQHHKRRKKRKKLHDQNSTTLTSATTEKTHSKYVHWS